MSGEDNLQPGGIQGSMPLSDMPPLGNYRIQAQLNVSSLLVYVQTSAIRLTFSVIC